MHSLAFKSSTPSLHKWEILCFYVTSLMQQVKRDQSILRTTFNYNRCHKCQSKMCLFHKRKHSKTILCSLQIPSNHCTNKQCYWITQQIILQLGHTRPSGLQTSLRAKEENFEDKYCHMWKPRKKYYLLAWSIILKCNSPWELKISYWD